MTASDHTLKPFRNLLQQRGHPYMHKWVDGIHIVNPSWWLTALSSYNNGSLW